MERKNTVFIVGAGASREFGMPTGSDLLGLISKLKVAWTPEGKLMERSSGPLRALLTDLGVQNDEMQEATAFVARNMALAPSIDNFLHTHSKNNTVKLAGKAMIAFALSQAERDSTLFAKRPSNANTRAETRIDFATPKFHGVWRDGLGAPIEVVPAPGRSWLGKIFWMLVSNRGYDEFCDALKRIKFICFNYDSCIEQFLAFAIRSYFDRPHEEVEQLISSVEIIRPYGALREYHFIPDRQVFGSLEAIHLREAAEGIRTFTESAATEFGDRSAACLQDASTVSFLGFGYLDLNMRRLFGEQRYFPDRVLGTALGMSPETLDWTKRRVVGNLVKGIGRSDERRAHPDGFSTVELKDMTCSDLIDFHWAHFESELLAKLA